MYEILELTINVYLPRVAGGRPHMTAGIWFLRSSCQEPCSCIKHRPALASYPMGVTVMDVTV